MLVGNELRRSLIWPHGSQQDQQSSHIKPHAGQRIQILKISKAEDSTAFPGSASSSAWLTSHGKKIFLIISCLTFLFQLKPFASHPPAMHCCEEPGSIFSRTSLYALQNAARLPQNCPFSRLNKLYSLSFSTHLGQVLPTLMSGCPSAELITVYQYIFLYCGSKTGHSILAPKHNLACETTEQVR